MSQVAAGPGISYAAYLEGEAGSEAKHEFLDGRIFAMAGGTPAHARLGANVPASLSAQLRGRPCVVFGSDLRVRVLETGLATYPDVSVVCGALEHDPEDSNAITNPVVLVEVLSDSTEAYDRGQKFAHYRRIPSLREYVMVSQRERRIERYSANDDGTWTLSEAGPGGEARLESIACVLEVDAVYFDPLAG